MKLFLSLGLIMCIAVSCNYKKLNSQDLTNITAIRDVSDPNETQKESTAATQQSGISSPQNTIAPTTFTRPQSNRKFQEKYNIIVASFAHNEKNKADKLVQKLKSMDYPATIIDFKGRYRVSIASYSDQKTAEAERDKYREITDRKDIWIFKTE